MKIVHWIRDWNRETNYSFILCFVFDSMKQFYLCLSCSDKAAITFKVKLRYLALLFDNQFLFSKSCILSVLVIKQFIMIIDTAWVICSTQHTLMGTSSEGSVFFHDMLLYLPYLEDWKESGAWLYYWIK